jgi:hypothetical protein
MEPIRARLLSAKYGTGLEDIRKPVDMNAIVIWGLNRRGSILVSVYDVPVVVAKVAVSDGDAC